ASGANGTSSLRERRNTSATWWASASVAGRISSVIVRGSRAIPSRWPRKACRSTASSCAVASVTGRGRASATWARRVCLTPPHGRDPLDDLPLGAHVAVAVVTVALRQRALELGVFRRDLGMGPQMVAKRQQALPRRVTAEHQVHVAHPPALLFSNEHDALRPELTVAWRDRLETILDQHRRVALRSRDR